MQKKFVNSFLLITGSVIWLLIGWVLHSLYTHAIAPLPVMAQPSLIEKAREVILNQQFLTTTIPSDQLTYAAIHGMLARTGDPKAALFTPPASAYYDQDSRGETGASGVLFDVIDKKIVILEVPPGLPAARAGIQAGDIIVGINGVIFDESSTGDEVSLLFRGPIGTTAKITVQRNHQQLEFDVVRAELPIFTTQTLDAEIGYIKQRLFPLYAEKEMQEILRSLIGQRTQALIWDLRNSRGGSMQAAEEILKNFIKEGVLYRAEFKDGHQQQFSVPGNTVVIDLPLVVLIDHRTYSASEMAAIALAEHHRAILIGTHTEGKGTIQDTIALDDKHLLRVTIAKWLSPTGTWIQDRGVIPDIEVVDDPQTAGDEVLDFAKNYIHQEFLQTDKP